MSRSHKSKRGWPFYKKLERHRKAKRQRLDSKARVQSGIMQKDDIWLIPEEVESLVSHYYPEL